MDDANDAPNDSKNPFFIWSEYKPENGLFNVPCSSFYYKEFSYLLTNYPKLRSKGVKLYFYLRVICKNYPEPPSWDRVTHYVRGATYSDVEYIYNIPKLSYGKSTFIPKICIRDLLLKGYGMNLLALALFCFLTNKKGSFQCMMRSQAIPHHVVSGTLHQLRALGYIKKLIVGTEEFARAGQGYAWLITHSNIRAEDS